MQDGQLWGTVVRQAIEASNRQTPFGRRVAPDVATHLPNNSPEIQRLAVDHLVRSVATLQALVQALADELDRREVPAYQ